MISFSVRVPASSANLGPGFDALAVALGLYLTLDVEATGDDECHMSGRPDLYGGQDLILTGLQAVAEVVGRPLPGCRTTAHSDIPVARGLGSSATALVAGLVAGNRLLGDPLTPADLLRLATDFEGHGDNVSASLFGGITLTLDAGGQLVSRQVPIAAPLSTVAFVPDVIGLTRDARAVVPDEVPRGDAVANLASCGLLVLALTTGELPLLRAAMMDRLHQPYRSTLFPHVPRLIAAAEDAGAYGASLSGAGPSVLALTDPRYAAAVAAAMDREARACATPGRSLVLEIAVSGAEVLAPVNQPV